MPSFQFLSVKQLDANIVKLLSDVYESHKGDVETHPRNAQIELIGHVLDHLKYVTEVPDLAGEKEANKNHRRDLHKQWQEKTKQIEELDAIAEKTTEQVALLKKLNEEQKKLQIERQALSNFIKNKFRNQSATEDQYRDHVLTDENRSEIITGMLLAIKKSIETVEYGDTYKNKAISAFAWIVGKKNDPMNSVLYRGIDAAIGITAENKLDDVSAKKALNEYNQFTAVIEELKAKQAQLAEGKATLKKVEEKDKKYRDPLYFLTVADHVLASNRGDLLLDTAEEKARYNRYTESELAYLNFKGDINPLINDSVQQGLSHVDAVEKHGALHTVTDAAHAKLPNGKTAKNKTIRDNEDPTHYMTGVTLPVGNESVVLDADQQKSAYANSMKFFAKNGAKQQLEKANKLKHVVVEPKPQDANTVKFAKR